MAIDVSLYSGVSTSAVFSNHEIYLDCLYIIMDDASTCWPEKKKIEEPVLSIPPATYGKIERRVKLGQVTPNQNRHLGGLGHDFG